MKITASLARKLGWYIYVYVNPMDEEVFYVGKGHGDRALQHLKEKGRTPKLAMIRSIRRKGFEPRLEILAHGIESAESALRMEAAVIDALGLKGLMNQVRGWRSIQYGRIPLPELIAHYDRRRVEIEEPSILIRINQLYRPGMSPVEVYDATRGVWKLGPERRKAKYAFAIFEGVIREVYQIVEWFAAGSTFSTRDPADLKAPGRWEFVGRIAPTKLRSRYVNRYVGHLFQAGAQNPIKYLNLE